MDRIKNDPTLKNEFDMQDGTLIGRPIIVVHAVDGDAQQYLILPQHLDPMLAEPTKFGIILSDLLDHIAAAYAHISNADERTLRDHIMLVMRKENRFKDDDPTRGTARGTTIMTRTN